MAKRSNARYKKTSLPKLYLIFVMIAFVLLGGYAIWHIFAASPGILEAERMKRPGGISRVFSDSSASGKKAVLIGKNSHKALTGSISSVNSASGFSIMARAASCHRVSPKMRVNLDSSTFHKSFAVVVNSIGWKVYETSGLKIPANTTFKVTLAYSAPKVRGCQTALLVDVIRLKVLLADVSGTKASQITTNSVLVSATVTNHQKHAAASFHVEYGKTTAYGAKSATKKTNGTVGAHNVQARLTKLTPNTTYHFRVCAVNSAGTSCGPDATFTTHNDKATKPDVSGLKATKVTKDSALLMGVVTTHGSNGGAGKYHFDYGKTTAYGSKTTEKQTGGAATGAHNVQGAVSKLTKSTTYHYRLCASNSGGTSCTADGTFTTKAK